MGPLPWDHEWWGWTLPLVVHLYVLALISVMKLNYRIHSCNDDDDDDDDI